MAGFVPLPCDVRVLELVRAHIKRGTDADAIDPAVDGLAVMEIQRANPHLDNGDVVFIGGFAQLTTVTADCVTSRIIHRWPDKIRERIGYIGGEGRRSTPLREASMPLKCRREPETILGMYADDTVIVCGCGGTKTVTGRESRRAYWSIG